MKCVEVKKRQKHGKIIAPLLWNFFAYSILSSDSCQKV